MLRCFMSKNAMLPEFEKRMIGRLFYKIAEVLDIKDVDAKVTVEIYDRDSPFDPDGAFALGETNPYRIRLANTFNEPFFYNQRDCSHFKFMGRSLAHEMIHLKQALRDGLARSDGDARHPLGYMMFRGLRYPAEEALRDPSLRHMPFEREAYAKMEAVYEAAVAKL